MILLLSKMTTAPVKDEVRVRHGFSLLELMIALAMATAVAAAALMASAQIGRSMSDTRRRVLAFDEAKRIVEAVISEFQQSGGNPLSPAQALVVENGTCSPINGQTEEATIPACDGQDRIVVTAVRTTFIDSTGAERSLGSCEVESVTGSVLHLRKDDGGLCRCLFPETPVGRGNSDDEPSPFSRSTVVLVRDSDGQMVPLRLKGTVAGCAMLVAPPAPGETTPALAPGSIVPVTRRHFFTRPDLTLPGARQLVVWTDVGNGVSEPDGKPSLDELSLVADHVFSFQVALGYDAGDDGDLLDRSAPDDEWVGNAPNDTRPTSIADNRLLRMVGVGVVVGDRANLANAGVGVFDGPRITAPGIHLATATTKVALRNLNISVP
jgi:prepilin-type N-terminal cleavage/methylation domain-containing protein